MQASSRSECVDVGSPGPPPLTWTGSRGGASRGPGHLLVSLGRGQEAARRVVAPAVVEGFDVLEDRAPCRRPGREAGAVDELVLERAEEALHRRVVDAP